MSKGSRPRPCNKQRFDSEYERIFGKRKLNVWEEPPDGIQGDPGDGACDQADGGQDSSVPVEPAPGGADPEATELVASSRLGTRRTVRIKKPKDTDYWTYTGYRGEYACPHGIGHGNHFHSCDGCCKRDDFPLKERKQEEDEEDDAEETSEADI